MRDVPLTITQAVADGAFVGDRKPTGRVTVQHPKMKLRNYSLMSTYTDKVKKSKTPSVPGTFYTDYKHGHKVNQTYADFFFTGLNKPMELPNVVSIEWQRSLDSSVADATITLLNTKPLEPGETPVPGEIDIPGYYTYSRGGTVLDQVQHGQTTNDWFGMLVPDNIIRTYEGYGSDLTKAPELDPFLVQTGVWIIDSVAMSTSGSMTIKCRDVGRILMDQMFYWPVAPKDWYNEGWSPWDDVASKGKKGRLKVKAEASSNDSWIPSGIIAGHKLADAFDGNPNTYWVSVGNIAASRRFAYEWVQCTTGNQTVSEVRFRTKKKGYLAYVSVMVDGVWQGANTINYHRDGIGHNNGDIAYVASKPVTTEGEVVIKLPKSYKSADRVRVTLGNLQNFHFGTYHYRAGIREVAVYGITGAKEGYTVGPAGSNPGKFSDFTDIVKLLCAWGGFFWPIGGRQRISNPPTSPPKATIPGYKQYRTVSPVKADPVLGAGVKGRVWGDFMQTGTASITEMDASNFDKKSLMDCITFIKDKLGFLFYIDELGGIQWRLANVYHKGCWATSLNAKGGYRGGFVHLLTDKTNMFQLDATIDSGNVREGYFVGNQAGKIGAYAPGFNPNPTGLRRIAGWTDQDFASQKECEVMADMLSLRQLFTYRTDHVQIIANPSIQIDDQVRLKERTTADGYLHYVKGISSKLDHAAGTWTYDLDTNWLGYDPSASWTFYPEQLYHATRDYLDNVDDLSSNSLSTTRTYGAPS